MCQNRVPISRMARAPTNTGDANTGPGTRAPRVWVHGTCTHGYVATLAIWPWTKDWIKNVKNSGFIPSPNGCIYTLFLHLWSLAQIDARDQKTPFFSDFMTKNGPKATFSGLFLHCFWRFSPFPPGFYRGFAEKSLILDTFLDKTPKSGVKSPSMAPISGPSVYGTE